MNTRDNWENIKYFIALAKEKQLKRAAIALNSNHTTVYRRICQFEESYNLRLFERTPSGYFLTAQGEALYNSVSGLEGQMDSVFSSLQGLENTLKGDICITTTPSFAMVFMAEIIQKFQQKWPELVIDLRVSHQIYNLSKREADIAIRPATDVPQHLMGRRVGAVNFGVFRSTRYKPEISKSAFLNEIDRHKFIVLSEELGHLSSKRWLDKLISEQNIICRVDRLTSSSELCIQGLGLAVLPLYYSDMHRGLELVYQPDEFIGNDIWVLTHKNLSRTPKIKVCTEFFYHELKKKLTSYLSV